MKNINTADSQSKTAKNLSRLRTAKIKPTNETMCIAAQYLDVPLWIIELKIHFAWLRKQNLMTPEDFLFDLDFNRMITENKLHEVSRILSNRHIHFYLVLKSACTGLGLTLLLKDMIKNMIDKKEATMQELEEINEVIKLMEALCSNVIEKAKSNGQKLQHA